jgi:hypothetical protein
VIIGRDGPHGVSAAVIVDRQVEEMPAPRLDCPEYRSSVRVAESWQVEFRGVVEGNSPRFGDDSGNDYLGRV